MTWCNFPMNGNYHEPSVDWFISEMKSALNDIKDFKYNVGLEINNVLNSYLQDGKIVMNSIYINVLNPGYGLEPLKNDGTGDNSDNLNAIIQYLKVNNIQGTIFFPAGRYNFYSQIKVDWRHITFLGDGRGGSNIILMSDINPLFLIDASDGTLLNFIFFEKLFFNMGVPTPSIAGYIGIKNASYVFIQNCSMYNAVNYISIDTSLGVKVYNTQLNNETALNNVIGINIKNRCPSCKFILVTMNFIKNHGAIGFNVNGYVQDLLFNKIETTGCEYVFFFSNSNSPNPGDIMITECIADLIEYRFCQFTNISSIYDNTVIIAKNYITCNNGEIDRVININNCKNILIESNMIINTQGGTTETAINIVEGENILVSGNQLIGVTRGIGCTNSKHILLNGNEIKNNNANSQMISAIVLDDTILSSIVNNIISGNITTAISIDADSTNVLYTNNIIHGTNGAASAVTITSESVTNNNNIVVRE